MGNCSIQFVPAGATFGLEQSAALNASGVHGLSLDGGGGRLVFADASSPFLYVLGSSRVSVSNMSLIGIRPPFTYGVVQPAAAAEDEGRVVLSVNSTRYPFDPARYPWTAKADCMHEVVPADFTPRPNGLDWLYTAGVDSDRLNLTAVPTSATSLKVSFADLGSGQSFGLAPGSGVVLRHVLEYSRSMLDSFVFRSCTGVTVKDVTVIRVMIRHDVANLLRRPWQVFTSPGMAVLAHDCTDVRLERVRNEAAPGAPLAGNADALHLASCRGAVVIKECVAERQVWSALSSVCLLRILGVCPIAFGGMLGLVLNLRHVGVVGAGRRRSECAFAVRAGGAGIDADWQHQAVGRAAPQWGCDHMGEPVRPAGLSGG